MLAEDQGWDDHSLNAGHCPPGARWSVLPFYIYWLNRQSKDFHFHVWDLLNRDFFDNKEITIGFFRFYLIKTLSIQTFFDLVEN